MNALQRYGLLLGIFGAFLLIGQVTGQEVKPKYSNVCVNDTTCPDNAFCKIAEGSGYCACKDGFIIHIFNTTHRVCLREANNVGDPCVENIQCHSKLSLKSECFQERCRCQQDSHFEERRCYLTSLIGQKCTVSNNCYLGPVDSSEREAYCVRGTCQCNILHTPRDGGTRCLRDAMLGDKCEDNDHCTGENTECRDVCRCKDDNVVEPLEKKCLKAASILLDNCEIEAQCTKYLNGTTCVGQKCICRDDHHLDNGRCWKIRAIGERCMSNQECKNDEQQHGRCEEGVCVCDDCGMDKGSSSNIMPKLEFIIVSLFMALAMY